MKQSYICKRLLALCLVLTLVLGMSGCNRNFNTVQTNLMQGDEAVNEAMHSMLDAIAAGDDQAAMALLHPEQNSKPVDIISFLQQLPTYMPIKEDYELSVEKITVNANLGTQGKVKSVSGVYKIEFDGQTFYAVYTYVSSAGGKGFTQLRFLNEADYSLLQGIG